MYSYDEILRKALAMVPSDVDKSEGSLIFDAIAPKAAIAAQMYAEIEKIVNQSFADTATGTYLERRAAELGVNRKQATYAVRKGVFDTLIPLGSRFSIEDINYAVTDNIEGNKYKLKSETAGTIGNVYSGKLTAISFVEGLNSAVLTDILIPGENTESDESLRKRYYDNLESQAFGGNVADYKEKVKMIQGIGGVKIYPVWNGGGTVKLVIIDSNFNTPSDELINLVQLAIDPVGHNGKGYGIAPIGHIVTVTSVENKEITVESNITLIAGYVWDDVKSYLKEAIDNYFAELRKTWDSENCIVVRISQIENAILHVVGVLDVQNTKLNGYLTNLMLTDVQIPVLNEVTKG